MSGVKFSAALIISCSLAMGHAMAQTANAEKIPPTATAQTQSKLSIDSQQYVPDAFSDKVWASSNADLAKLPAKSAAAADQ